MKPSQRLSSLLLFVTIANATCFFPDGTSIQDTPCDPQAAHSACCGPGYACLSNHICALTSHVPSTIAKLSSYYVRGSCTDSTFASDACPRFCTNSTNGDNLGVGGMGMGKCDGDGSVNWYYCRNTNTADVSDNVLCANPLFHVEFQGYPTTVTVIGIATSTPPAPQSSSTASSLPSSSQSPAPTSIGVSKTDLKLILELILSLILPLFLATTALGYLFLRSRRSSTAHLSGMPLFGDGRAYDVRKRRRQMPSSDSMRGPRWPRHPRSVFSANGAPWAGAR